MKRANAVFMLMLAAGVPSFSGCATTGPAPGAASNAPSGNDVVSDVINRLREDPMTARYPFSVTVDDDGVATIGGSVGDQDAHLRAISIVRGAPGVKGVIDNLSR